MVTSINALAAAEHSAELRRVAARRDTVRGGVSGRRGAEPESPPIALRLARADEDRVVRGLAELDDAPALDGPVLLAVIDGVAVAALSLRDGRAVANPFTFTEDAVALLRLRARHLSDATPRRGWRAVLRPRIA